MENFSFEKKKEKTLIGFDYVIYNPNWYKVIVKPSKLKLKIAGQDCGWVTVTEKIKIKRKKEGAYHFVLEGEPGMLVKSAFSSVWSMMVGDGVEFNLRGKLKAGALILRKKWDINCTYQMSYEEFLSFL